jgi:galactosylceramidase
MHAPEPWSRFYEVGQAIWASAHTTQFTEIGWHYLGHGSGVGQLEAGGSFVSLTDGRQLSIVVESIAHDQAVCAHEDAPTSPVEKQSVTFALQGDFASISSLHSFMSSFDPQSPIVNFQYAGSVDVSGGSFSFTLLPNQLWTFSTLNGTKGSHPQPPPRAAFPIPYSDSFDSSRLHSQARYLTDQSGSFEVVEARNASRGRVLRQMMPAYPVPWCGDAPFPYSVIGDHSWAAVNASVDVLLERSGTALLAVGVDSGGCLGSGGSRAVVVSVNSSSVWTVSNSTALLYSFGSGKAEVQSGQWINIAVHSHAAGSDFLINGQLMLRVAELSSDDYKGWVAIGSSYDYVQFDNLVIEKGAASVKTENVQRE